MRPTLLPILSALAACAHAPPAVGPSTSAQVGQIQRFRIGELEAVALKDGDIDIPNDGKTLGIGRSTAEVGDLLAAAGLPRERTELSIQPLLVKDGAHVLLFDTGAGSVSWARGGRLPQSLALAGVAPGEVTDIFISHSDLDHIGGLVTAGRALAFPSAVIHVSSPEWAAMQTNPEASGVTPTIAPTVAAFEPGARLLPEVMAVATPGHTPGHSSYEIASAGEKLFYLGDVAHHFVVSVQRPAWTIDYDQKAPAAEAMRQKVLASLAHDGELVYAVHFPFPGLGHVQTAGEGFVWVPQR
jgi:glyoxylase-like metal-dependent hydrolase (beta-lactamase superfamily II)